MSSAEKQSKKDIEALRVNEDKLRNMHSEIPTPSPKEPEEEWNKQWQDALQIIIDNEEDTENKEILRTLGKCLKHDGINESVKEIKTLTSQAKSQGAREALESLEKQVIEYFEKDIKYHNRSGTVSLSDGNWHFQQAKFLTGKRYDILSMIQSIKSNLKKVENK